MVSIVHHEHPLPVTGASELPFAIINGRTMVQRPKLLALLECVVNETPTRLMIFRPVYSIC